MKHNEYNSHQLYILCIGCKKDSQDKIIAGIISYAGLATTGRVNTYPCCLIPSWKKCWQYHQTSSIEAFSGQLLQIHMGLEFANKCNNIILHCLYIHKHTTEHVIFHIKQSGIFLDIKVNLHDNIQTALYNLTHSHFNWFVPLDTFWHASAPYWSVP